MQKNVGCWEESRASMLVTFRSEAMLCYAYLDNYFMSGAADALTARGMRSRGMVLMALEHLVTSVT